MRRRRGSGIPASDLLAVVASERTPGATAYEGLARRPSSKQSKLRSTAQLPKSPVHKENDSKHITSRVPRLRARRGRRPADGGALRGLGGRLHNVPVAPPIRRTAEEPPLLDRGAAAEEKAALDDCKLRCWKESVAKELKVQIVAAPFRASYAPNDARSWAAPEAPHRHDPSAPFAAPDPTSTYGAHYAAFAAARTAP